MEEKIANIVIVANLHNPTILSEEWLDSHGVLPKGVLVLRTPQISVVKSELVEMVADPNRVQFTITDKGPDAENACAKAAENYFKALPHIPYIAMGFNFHYLIDEADKLGELSILYDKKEISEVIKKEKSSQGFIHVWTEKEARCRVTYDPTASQGKELIFNFHFEPLSRPEVTAVEHLTNFKFFHEQCLAISSLLIRRGESQ
jgi:hypothetical protein